MSTYPHDVLMADAGKGNEGKKVFDQAAVAHEGLASMVAFLCLDPHPSFTADDADLLTHECDRLAAACGQMNAGQEKYAKKTYVNFDEIPHIMTRICALAMRLVMSGRLRIVEGDGA